MDHWNPLFFGGDQAQERHFHLKQNCVQAIKDLFCLSQFSDFYRTRRHCNLNKYSF